MDSMVRSFLTGREGLSNTYNHDPSNASALRLFTADSMLLADLSPATSKLIWSLSILIALLIAHLLRRHSKTYAPDDYTSPSPELPYARNPGGRQDLGIETAWRMAKLHDDLGPIYQSGSFGVKRVWLGNRKIAQDLLVHRENKYRPQADLLDSNRYAALPAGYVDDHTNDLTHGVHELSTSEWRNVLALSEIEDTMRRLLEVPTSWSQSLIDHCAASAAARILGNANYGSMLSDNLHQLVNEETHRASVDANLTASKSLLQRFLSWSRRQTSPQQTAVNQLREPLVKHASRMEYGTAESSWMQNWLEPRRHIEDHEIARALASLATSSCALYSFFTAMCLHPTQLSRLQRELDASCRGRMATAEDVARLPVLQAMVKETLRWRPVAPFSEPYVALEDDVYDGYHIWEGTVIHVNQYAITRNVTTYPQPEDFNPDRWLHATKQTSTALDSQKIELCVLVAAIAWAFDIKKKEGREGYDAEIPWYDTKPLASMMTRPFAIEIRARTEEKRRKILDGP